MHSLDGDLFIVVQPDEGNRLRLSEIINADADDVNTGRFVVDDS